MQLAEINEAQAATIVAVLGAVATARGTQEPSIADRVVIGSAARHVLGGAEIPAELAVSIPGAVADQLAAGEAGELTLDLASILCFTDATDAGTPDTGFLDPARVTVVDDLARYLNVAQRDVRELRLRAHRQREQVAFDLYRRFPVGTSTGTSTGAATMVERVVLQAETRLDIDARRVHALWDRTAGLPDGTVGAELIRYYRENDWKYPGTDHHLPLTFVAHDAAHVLGGYATTPLGELQVGAFTAGVAGRPLEGAVTFLLWEQLATGSPMIAEAPEPFDSERYLFALARGTRTTQDFAGADWDPWSIIERDLAEVRADHQIGEGAQLGPLDPYDMDPYDVDRVPANL